MKILNTEFVRKLAGHEENFNGYLVEFDEIAPFFLKWNYKKSNLTDVQKMAMRSGLKATGAHVFTFTARNVEPMIGPALGLPDADWHCKLALDPCTNKTLKCAWTGDGLNGKTSNGVWLHAGLGSWRNIDGPLEKQGRDYMEELCRKIAECEDLYEFLVSPARWYEFMELKYTMDVEAIQKDIDKKNKCLKGSQDKKNKFGGLELKLS